MKQKIYLVNYYEHLVGDSANKGAFLNYEKAKKRYLELVEEKKESILNEAENAGENPKNNLEEAKKSDIFYGDCEGSGVLSLCRIETIEIENIKLGDDIYLYNFCDEDLGNSRTIKIFKTEKQMKKELENQIESDFEYFENCCELDLENEFNEKEFEKLKQKRLKEVRKENCLYCYELDEYFCHKFEKVKVE